jgi:hypothetical protein
MGYNTTIGQMDLYQASGWVSNLVTTSTSNKLTATQLPTGSVLQVVQATFTGTQTISATSGFNWTDITSLSLSITPSSSSNKVLLCAYITYTFAADRIAAFRFQGGNSTAFVATAAGSRAQTASWSVSPGAGGQLGATTPMVYLDSPATTSAITYKVQGGPNFTSGNLAINYNITNDGDLTYIARGACSFIAMEIAG